MMSISIDDKIEEIERELSYRPRVYDRRVAEGRMSRQQADRRIEVMQAILGDYQAQASEQPDIFEEGA